MTVKNIIAGALLAVTLVACSTTPPSTTPSTASGKSKTGGATNEAQRAKTPGEKDWRPATHQVAKGDTMYSIAFNYGLDYHELAELNGLKDPRRIQIGQVLQLFPAAAKSPAVAESKPVDNAPKDQPKVVKYIYNDAAMAQIDEVQGSKIVTAQGGTIEVLTLPAKSAVVPPASKVEAAPADNSILNTEEDALQWGLPASGKVIAQFSEADNRKGIDIAGKLGQDVLASAPGKVVYSGSGLRGYGKLIIIKHNKTFLSAYAHNDKVLVKEGQAVKRGEKIAEMGKTDTDRVMLHFEVRRLGKPVDPAKYLPKS